MHIADCMSLAEHGYVIRSYSNEKRLHIANYCSRRLISALSWFYCMMADREVMASHTRTCNFMASTGSCSLEEWKAMWTKGVTPWHVNEVDKYVYILASNAISCITDRCTHE